MKISHHLEDDILLDYAAGTLAEGWAIAVASHLALCPQCRRHYDTMEHAGGGMLDTIASEPHSDSSWTALRSRIAGSMDHAKPVQPSVGNALGPAILPEPLRSYVGSDVDTIRWKSMGPGAHHFPIKTGDTETTVRLLRIPAGQPVPEHSHGGRELTLVLSGAFTDGEEHFGRGDIEDADGSVTHQPIATPDADCICLAVTDAPLKFSSWLVRLVQPILKI